MSGSNISLIAFVLNYMRSSSLLLLLFWLPFQGVSAQTDSLTPAGQISLGVRSSWGLVYEHNWNRAAFGSGGQFRLRFSEKVNSDWFIDYLQGDLGDFAKRTDVHIGWSVLYYPLNKKTTLQPYLLAGHCFELLRISENTNDENFVIRKSASVQAGAGVHLHLTPKADVSFVAQYMIHFGTNIDVADNPVTFTKPSGIALQDHILLHVSLNYQIADLW